MGLHDLCFECVKEQMLQVAHGLVNVDENGVPCPIEGCTNYIALRMFKIVTFTFLDKWKRNKHDKFIGKDMAEKVFSKILSAKMQHENDVLRTNQKSGQINAMKNVEDERSQYILRYNETRFTESKYVASSSSFMQAGPSSSSYAFQPQDSSMLASSSSSSQFEQRRILQNESITSIRNRLTYPNSSFSPISALQYQAGSSRVKEPNRTEKNYWISGEWLNDKDILLGNKSATFIDSHAHVERMEFYGADLDLVAATMPRTFGGVISNFCYPASYLPPYNKFEIGQAIDSEMVLGVAAGVHPNVVSDYFIKSEGFEHLEKFIVELIDSGMFYYELVKLII